MAYDREIVRQQGERCACGETYEEEEVRHHVKTGNKIIDIKCICGNLKRTTEIYPK